MAELDLLLRGGNVVTDREVRRLDIGIAEGAICAVEPELARSSAVTLDITGLHVFPGVIDSHVHLNEPGRAHWEGFDTGTSALAAGGATLFFDMPLNAHPPTLDRDSFALKLRAAQASSHIDFALWGGLVPGNVDKLEELSDCGVVGFKAFMSNSGIDDFENVDDNVLRAGMERAANLKKIVAVHAESDDMTHELAAQKVAAGKTSVRDYLDSRPVEAELDAIRRAINIAGETGCALHVVHVSSGAGVAVIAEARQNGVDVSCETCPHYLILTEDDLLNLGAVAKCAPPLRDAATREELWNKVTSGNILTIGSDHSPAPPNMKKDSSFFKVWGGISGAQHTLPLMIQEGTAHPGFDLPTLTRLLSTNVATRFRLPLTKGRLAAGCDADLAICDLSETRIISSGELLDRHRQSPYIGRKVRARVTHTLVRGQFVLKDGNVAAQAVGKLVKPVT